MASNPKQVVELTPNAVTIAAMQEARQDKLETVTLDELQAVLDADDDTVELMQTQEPSP
jgi:hypothetical protein